MNNSDRYLLPWKKYNKKYIRFLLSDPENTIKAVIVYTYHRKAFLKQYELWFNKAYPTTKKFWSDKQMLDWVDKELKLSGYVLLSEDQVDKYKVLI